MMHPRAIFAADYERMLKMPAAHFPHPARLPAVRSLPYWHGRDEQCLSDGGDTGSTFSIADFGSLDFARDKFSIWMANGLTARAARLSRGVDVVPIFGIPDVPGPGVCGHVGGEPFL